MLFRAYECATSVAREIAGGSMASTPIRRIRLSDEVWREIQKLKRVYGTHEAGFRAVFRLKLIGDAPHSAATEYDGTEGLENEPEFIPEEELGVL